MIKITWDGKELEGEIRSFEKGEFDDFGYFSLTLAMYIDNVEIIGGAYNYGKLFFNMIYGAFQFIDPDRLGSKNLYVVPDNRISGEGFEFYLKLNKKNDMLTIEYQRADSTEFKIIEVPFKEFIEGVLESNESLLTQIQEISPNLINNPSMIEFKNEMKIIKDWYHEIYGKMGTD